jgi:hypothetical protein
MNGISGMNLQIPTQSLMAALSNLQSLPMKMTMQNQELSRKLLGLSVAIKVQDPQLGCYINIYG